MNKIQTSLKLLFFVTFFVCGNSVWASDDEPESPQANQVTPVLGQIPVIGSAYSSNFVQNAVVPGAIAFTAGTAGALFVPPLAPFAGWVGLATGTAGGYYSWSLSDVKSLAQEIKRKVYTIGRNLQQHRDETAEGFRRVEGQLSEMKPYIESTAAAVGRIESNQTTEAAENEKRHNQLTARLDQMDKNNQTAFANLHQQGLQTQRTVNGMVAHVKNTDRNVQAIAARMGVNTKLGKNGLLYDLDGVTKKGGMASFVVQQGMKSEKSLRPSFKPRSYSQDFSTNSDSRDLFRS